MSGRVKISIVSGIIFGLAIVATLHNYSNYKKEKAIETDESSSITSADYNETTTKTSEYYKIDTDTPYDLTSADYNETTTTTTKKKAKTTTTKSSKKVPIKWIKSNVDTIKGYWEIYVDGGKWDELPSVIDSSVNGLTPPEVIYKRTKINIDITFNSGAYAKDLKVSMINNNYEVPLDECKIEYKKGKATITGCGYCESILLGSKSTGKTLKTIPVKMSYRKFEWDSSNKDVLSFNDDFSSYSVNKSGKTVISYKYGGKVIAKKEVSVVA